MAKVKPTGSDKQFNGEVWQVSPVIDPSTRQGIARIALAFAPELRVGGFATARLSSGTMTATVLPESAVLADSEGSFVYVIDKENKAVRRGVKTGMVTEQGLVITEGLTGNERVVLRSGGFLSVGETVNPQPLKK
jgi:multidrug efflux pump subunit AcrA (membrane-fusion protein)